MSLQKEPLLQLVQGAIDPLMHLASLLVEINHPTPTTYWVHKSQGTTAEGLPLPSGRISGSQQRTLSMGMEKEMPTLSRGL